MNTALLIIGTASGFGHSVYSAISKIVLKDRVRTPLLFLLYINIFQALATMVLWVKVDPILPPREGWEPLLAAGLTCLLAYLFLYSSLSCGDVSSVMPIMGSKVIFSGVLARLMLGEGHSWPIYLAIVLVAVSVAVLSYSPSREQHTHFRMRPIVLMLLCCVIFSFTDIFIKRSLVYLDSANFLVYYNLIVGTASLFIIPYLKLRGIPLRIPQRDMLTILLSAVFLIGSTLLFVQALKIAEGVVIPNILMATRGVFVVLISLVMTHRGSTMLDEQSKSVYAFRFAASLLIVLSIVIALKN
ncbi:MAG: EamA family transporter [Lentisphaerae bacterium]|jgi:drug/metabolite transporter (DMT)-like permease|nr:EamA family transporter [Lentisphaerota bacterium]MBT4822298.1 EamA family transporter [Lentisphaerota bacterium]MBT5611984.1 EamA family transporter [Lentisphaerota bacterium]MBT7060904.1 EamA family transporter [Lentisphaerota bacterium]MBT7847743.1 EamA family transporter [Lentisphaerota bacterium]